MRARHDRAVKYSPEQKQANGPATENDAPWPSQGPEDYGTEPAPSGEPRFKLIKFKDARPDFSRRRELVQGLFPSSGIAVVWGPPKCYKSFWTYDLCMHIARGLRYHGRRVHQCPVVYVALEGQAGFPDRLEGYRQHHEMDEDVPFHLVCTQLSLAKDADQLIADIKAQIGDTNPGVVTLDTLNRSLEGSESKDADMAAYLNAAEKIALAFRCLVIIVHHCGIEGTRPRGHTSLSGAAVVQIAVQRTADKFRASATVEMAKDMAEGAEVHFELRPINIGTDPDGDIVSSLVVLPAPGATMLGKHKMTGAQKVALDILREAIDEAGTVAPASNHIPAKVKTVHEDTWRTYAYKASITESDTQEAKQKAFARAANALKNAGLIGKWDKLVWIV